MSMMMMMMNLLCPGPIGVAAAAAISSTSKKRRRLHSFETNPSIRKRQQTRLQRCVSYLSVAGQCLTSLGDGQILLCCSLTFLSSDTTNQPVLCFEK